jgi:hypothetical protein
MEVVLLHPFISRNHHICNKLIHCFGCTPLESGVFDDFSHPRVINVNASLVLNVKNYLVILSEMEEASFLVATLYLKFFND